MKLCGKLRAVSSNHTVQDLLAAVTPPTQPCVYQNRGVRLTTVECMGDAMDNMKASFKPNKKSNKKLNKVVMRGEKSQKEVGLSISDLLVPFMKGQKKRRVGMNQILLDSKTTVRRPKDT